MKKFACFILIIALMIVSIQTGDVPPHCSGMILRTLALLDGRMTDLDKNSCIIVLEVKK